MINTKQELLNLLPHFYDCFNMPLFLLSEDLIILYSTKGFPTAEINYFQTLMQDQPIKQYKIFTKFYRNEFYFIFHYPLEDIDYICIGPYFNKQSGIQASPSQFDFFNHTNNYSMKDFLNIPSLHTYTHSHLSFVYQIITGNVITESELKESFHQSGLNPLKQEQKLDEEIFQMREAVLHEFSYSYEKKLINYMQNEDSTSARLLMHDISQIKGGPKLSQDRIQSLKYKLVAAITLFTRSVIDVGVPVEKAYSLSDIYINKVDQTVNINELKSLIYYCIDDFTSLVKRYKHTQNTYWIKKCKKYISHHLHQTITLEQLAKEVDMNPKYISTQFKKETGQSIKQYIQKEKVKEAQFLIKNSNYTLAEISDILKFSNQSHFNKVFKEVTCLTPNQYKNNQ